MNIPTMTQAQWRALKSTNLAIKHFRDKGQDVDDQRKGRVYKMWENYFNGIDKGFINGVR